MIRKKILLVIFLISLFIVMPNRVMAADDYCKINVDDITTNTADIVWWCYSFKTNYVTIYELDNCEQKTGGKEYHKFTSAGADGDHDSFKAEGLTPNKCYRVEYSKDKNTKSYIIFKTGAVSEAKAAEGLSSSEYKKCSAKIVSVGATDMTYNVKCGSGATVTAVETIYQKGSAYYQKDWHNLWRADIKNEKDWLENAGSFLGNIGDTIKGLASGLDKSKKIAGLSEGTKYCTQYSVFNGSLSPLELSHEDYVMKLCYTTGKTNMGEVKLTDDNAHFVYAPDLTAEDVETKSPKNEPNLDWEVDEELTRPKDLSANICDEGLRSMINKYWKWFIIIAPIGLIIFVSLDFIKAVISNDADALKKSSSNAVKRSIAVILILFTPFILKLIFGIFGLEDYVCI